MNDSTASRLRPARRLPWLMLALTLAGCAPSRVAWRNASPQDEEQWRRQQKLQQQPDCSVALWGDSILHGAHNGAHRLAEPPAAILQRLRPLYVVEDNSVPGDSAYARQPQFERLTLQARIVVLQYGINDAGHRYPYEPSFRAMVAHVKAEGRTPLITGLSRVIGGMAGRDENDAIARRIAADTGSVFADWGEVRFDPADMADGVHPGPRYAERLTAQLAKALDRVAPECAASGA